MTETNPAPSSVCRPFDGRNDPKWSYSLLYTDRKLSSSSFDWWSNQLSPTSR
jgi:hypothetical protein